MFAYKIRYMKYNPGRVEKKWQKIWDEQKIYDIPGKGKKFYHLVMFPYPSGDLHIGHWYNFSPADVYARKKRMEGSRVFSPIGFDAFGLPAENAAIKREIHPETWTYENIERMKKQLVSMGPIYDWSRELATCDPKYYKWTQWIFLQLFKAGLAYRKKVPANFCPSCNTVLANEQVVEGECERCGCEVLQRDIEQWLFHIREYVDELLSALNDLDWPEKTKLMQKNWIGKSEGVEVEFSVGGHPLRVFTTRPDTLFGATYLVISPEHPFLDNIKRTQVQNLEELESYVMKARKKSEKERTSEDKEKTGVRLEGVLAVNPLSGEEIPVFVGDYVLLHYGTGAIMAVPAHDKRDYSFAKKHNLPIKRVIHSASDLPYEGEGDLVASGEFTGMKSSEAKEKINQYLEKKKKAEKKVNYKIRDWLVSRQRYWGAPIPIIYCKNCFQKKGREGVDYTIFEGEDHAIIPVEEKDLPVVLPYLEDFTPSGEGRSPLSKDKNFTEVVCPRCGKEAKRETDTLDTFVCSSWYYLRYADPHNDKVFADKKNIKEWLPVDIYIGGAEHSVLHLLYSRFITKVLRDQGHLNFHEPFLKLRHQGMILGPDGQKMSKSKGNVVDPDKEVEKHGADAVRMYLCFMGPYDQGGPWNPRGILGVKRFLERVWKIKDDVKEEENKKLEKIMHQTVKKVTEDIEELRFNTAISAMMTFLNEAKEPGKEQMKTFLVLLSPFAPHFTEEVWSYLGFKGSIHNQNWPTYDLAKTKEEVITLVVQVNGKVRDKIEISATKSESQVKKIALESEKTKKWIDGKKIKKVVIIKNRLINIVTE